jgi:hypothetical protein
MGTLREDQYTILVLYRSQLLRTRNVSDESCRGNQNTFYGQYFFLNRASVLLYRYIACLVWKVVSLSELSRQLKFVTYKIELDMLL